MIDFSKPIRWKCDKTPVTISERFDDRVLVRWQCADGQWAAQIHKAEYAEVFFENIPPEPRRVTVWPVWPKNVDDKVAAFQDEKYANMVVCNDWGRVGKPIEIVEEYP